MEWMLMPLKRYADFSGRSRRMEYWMWVLFQFLIGMVFWVLMFAVGGGAMMSGDPNALASAGAGMLVIWALYMLLALAFFIPNLAVTVRRLHDTNRSGWWILAPMVPYVIAFVSIMGAAASGSQGGLAAGGIIGMVAVLAAIGLGITLLVFMFLEGTRGPNKYGPDPKAQDTSQVFA
jgi:uncharacterized membrane protein YhaH (DUF805 family)